MEDAVDWLRGVRQPAPWKVVQRGLDVDVEDGVVGSTEQN